MTETSSDVVEEKSASLMKEEIAEAASTEVLEDPKPNYNERAQEAEVYVQDTAATTTNHVWKNAAVAGVLIGASCCLMMALKMAKRR